MKEERLLEYPFFLLKVMQVPFWKFEPINNPSEKKKAFSLLGQFTCYCTIQSNSRCFQPFSQSRLYYLESIEWACQLEETLSTLTLLRLFIKEGSRCQRCSANWVVEKVHFIKYEVKSKPPQCLCQVWHFLLTFTTCGLLNLWTEDILSI